MSVKNGIYKNCTICSKEYYIRKDRAEASKYCSIECWKNRRFLNECEYCHEPIISYHGKRYCSRKCSHAAMVGKKSSRWIDGKSLDRDRARLGTEVKDWRNRVFIRDNYTCQKCGAKGEIHAHHIIEWAKDKSKRFDVDNGQTLCINCHGDIHGKNFKRRAKKKCPDCGKLIKRESKRCRRCATIEQWRTLNTVK